jgi:hypothetical protein
MLVSLVGCQKTKELELLKATACAKSIIKPTNKLLMKLISGFNMFSIFFIE